MSESTAPSVVVGVDGSESSRLALAWAVEDATRRKLPLHLLCAWHSDYAAETVAPIVPSIEEDCQSILEAAAAQARTLSPGIEVRSNTVRAQAASALIAASRHADTVVVGSRGLGAVKEALAGSTSMQVAAYASCPVVVVREVAAGHGATGRVVVGVDGSDLSTAATGYAFEQASQRGLGLTVLHAWNANVYTSSVAMSALAETWSDLEVEQEGITSAAIAGWTEEYPTSTCGPMFSRAAPPTSSSTPRRGPSWSSSAVADAAASAASCSVRSAAASCTVRTARSPSFDRSSSTIPTRTPRWSLHPNPSVRTDRPRNPE